MQGAQLLLLLVSPRCARADLDGRLAHARKVENKQRYNRQRHVNKMDGSGSECTKAAVHADQRRGSGSE